MSGRKIGRKKVNKNKIQMKIIRRNQFMVSESKNQNQIFVIKKEEIWPLNYVIIQL